MRKFFFHLTAFVFPLSLAAAKALGTQDSPSLVPGSSAPPIQIRKLYQAPAGSKASLESLKGKVVIIEFWATWCAPCIAQMPHLNELARKFKNSNVLFLAVSEEKPADVERFLKKGLIKTWVGTALPDKMFKDYKVSGMPTTVVIDKGGRITAVTRPENLTEEVINGILNQKELIDNGNECKGGGYLAQDDGLLKFSLKPSKLTTPMGGGSKKFGYFDVKGYLMKDLLAIGLGEASSKRIVSQVPLPEGRFDLVAQVEKSRASQLPLILKRKFESEFNIQLERKKIKLNSFVITMPSGPKGDLSKSTGGSFHLSASDGVLAARSTTLSTLLDHVEATINEIIVDKTNSKDLYNFLLQYQVGNRESLFRAMREMGLVISAKEQLIEVWVVKKG